MTWEREYFRLAGTMMACRLRCMGGDVEGEITPKGDLVWSLLGYLDYAAEMALVLQEARLCSKGGLQVRALRSRAASRAIS